MKKKSFALIVFLSLFLIGCNDFPWSKGEVGTALECRALVTDTRLTPQDDGYETIKDVYGWTVVSPEYLGDLMKDKNEIEKQLKECRLQCRQN